MGDGGVGIGNRDGEEAGCCELGFQLDQWIGLGDIG